MRGFFGHNFDASDFSFDMKTIGIHENSRHPDIRFTIEHTKQNDAHAVSYLEISVSVDHGVIKRVTFSLNDH